MHEINLRDVDLNLLVVLHALLQHGSVTRAAEQLGRSQSALSHALGRLRELFDDPLFVRVGNDMSTTDLAESLRGPLSELIDQAGRLFGQRTVFDPARLSRHFQVSGSDYAHTVVFAAALGRVRKEAPFVEISAVSMGNEVERGLQSGAIDLALGGNYQPLSGLLVQKLFDDHFVCLVREDHPAIRKSSLSLKAFLDAEHALAAPRGLSGSVVDQALAELGEERRVVFRTRHFLAAAVTASSTDLVLTLPARLAERVAPALRLRILKPPLKLPAFAFGMLYNASRRDDPGHAWLRGVLAECCRAPQ